MRLLLRLPLGLLAACAEEVPPGPTTEVTLAPGRYAVSLGTMTTMIGAIGTAAPTGTGGRPLPDSICVSANDAARGPEAIMKAAWDTGSSCESYDYDRKLNDISGRVSCQINNKDGNGTLQYVFTGKVRETSLTGEGYVRMEVTKFADPGGDAAENQDQVKEPFRIERQGDCTS